MVLFCTSATRGRAVAAMETHSLQQESGSTYPLDFALKLKETTKTQCFTQKRECFVKLCEHGRPPCVTPWIVLSFLFTGKLVAIAVVDDKNPTEEGTR